MTKIDMTEIDMTEIDMMIITAKKTVKTKPKDHAVTIKTNTESILI